MKMLINMRGAAGKFFEGLADYATWVPMSAEVKKTLAIICVRGNLRSLELKI